MIEKTNRQRADEFEEKVIQPLREARDHVYYEGVIRRHRTSSMLDKVIAAALRNAYDIKGRLARGED